MRLVVSNRGERGRIMVVAQDRSGGAFCASFVAVFAVLTEQTRCSVQGDVVEATTASSVTTCRACSFARCLALPRRGAWRACMAAVGRDEP